MTPIKPVPAERFSELFLLKKKVSRDVPNQEPLMVLRKEYLSDGGEQGFPWLR